MKFEILTADGRAFIGEVQGCGGTIAGRGALERLRTQAIRAAEGDPLGICEPEPGCCSVHVDGGRVTVPLTGARIYAVDAETETEEDRSERLAERGDRARWEQKEEGGRS